MEAYMEAYVDTLPVIVAVDGSPDSERALRWAVQEARLRSAALHVVHVRPYGNAARATVAEEGGSPEPPGTPSTGDQVLDDLRRRFGTVAGAEDLPETEFRSLNGTADAALPALGDEAQLLVLGSRGRGGFASLLLGSNGLACAAHSASPVVVVPRPDRARVDRAAGGPASADLDDRPGGRADATGERGAAGEARASAAGRGARVEGAPCEVALGVDAMSDEPAAIGFAFEEASRRGARLKVVSGYTWPLLAPPAFEFSAVYEGTQQEYENALSAQLDEALAPHRARHPEVRVDVTLNDTDAAGQLVEASGGCDLVVVARHRRRLPLGRRLGSVAHAVLLHALCPIAVVPEGGRGRSGE
ncbi:universal stress protein [Streptomyces sp. NPDC003077]|uniref:universal stress protein n=1 Tax=Streptomyces sp. NPDC003077 TaxID=3154443 RepID=UPI0033B3299C